MGSETAESASVDTGGPVVDEAARPYDVFISYSHKDPDRAWVVEWLLPRLRQNRLAVYIDDESFVIGDYAVNNMQLAVERSRFTLLVLTPNYVASKWTNFEAMLTMQGGRILPLIKEPCEVPRWLASLTSANFTTTSDHERELERVLAVIRGDSGSVAVAARTVQLGSAAGAPPVAPAPSAGHAVGGSVVALAELMRTPEGYAAAAQYRASFQFACRHIELLADYKQLHDQLDELQIGCYDQLVKQFGMRDVFDAVSGYAYNLDEIADDVSATIGKGNVTGQEEIWGKSLKRTAEIFRQAIDEEDLEKLKSARTNLQRILDRQPTRINGILCNEARQLDLAALISSIESLWNRLAETDRDSSKLQIIPGFLSDLRQLDALRTVLVNAHDGWQGIDDELRCIEVQLVTQNDLEYIGERWPEVKEPLQALCADCTEEWARQLHDSIEKLEGALGSGNPRLIRDAFAGLRRRQRNRFHKVDDELLSLCDRRLRPLGDSLKVVLSVIE